MDIFENICRTCGNDCLDALNIFLDCVTVMDKSIPISDLLSSCVPSSSSLPAPSSDDDYPKQICRVCIKKLIMFYEFNDKWITANSEFSVALKYEQRRNRSRLTQSSLPLGPDEQTPHSKCLAKAVDANIEPLAVDSAGIKAEGIVFKHEPSEGTEIATLIHDTELEHDLAAKTTEALTQPVNYQCAICEESYHTLAACKMHHRVSHRNWQFVYNIQ